MDFNTFKGNYENLAAAVTAANGYTDDEISALNIGLYAKTSDIQQWVNDKNYATNSALNTAINGANTTAQDYANTALADAKSYTDGKFNYASITEALYLTSKNSNDASGFYPAFINMRGSQYAYIDFYTVEDYATATDFPVRLITSHLEPGVLQLTSGRYGVGTLKIGNAYLTYDSDNNALFVKGANGSAINLVATGDVAAFSGLGSGFDTLTDLTLTNKLTTKTVDTKELTAKTSATIAGVKFYEDDDYCPVIDLSGDGESVGYITGADAFIMDRALVKKLQLYDSIGGNYKDIKYDGDNDYVYITINSVKYKFVMEKV